MIFTEQGVAALIVLWRACNTPILYRNGQPDDEEMIERREAEAAAIADFAKRAARHLFANPLERSE